MATPWLTASREDDELIVWGKLGNLQRKTCEPIARRKKAHVPKQIRFAEEWQITVQRIGQSPAQEALYAKLLS